MPGIMIEPDGVCIFVTEKCNSNCIMCPMSLQSRQRGLSIPDEEWNSILDNVPSDISHITITGGEPFLEYQNLIPIFEKINLIMPYADVLVLTNGRALSIKKIIDQIAPLITMKYCFAIPIHGSTADLHDSISQSPGSFSQSMRALKLLSRTDAKIEIRIVGHQHNIHDISEIYRTTVCSGAKIDTINLIAMEMMGCAAANRNSLWVPYQSLCEAALPGIQFAMLHGIDAGLYNFPLCTIPKELWPLAKDSITASKVRFDDKCHLCVEKNACGGLFYSTYLLGLCSIQPIVQE